MKRSSYAAISIAWAVLLVAPATAQADGINFSDKNRSVTNWLVVINYPEACSSVPCTEDDIFGALPENPTNATVCFLTGQVVRQNGKAVFAGNMAEGTSYGCFFPMDDNPVGLKDAMRAEVHVVVQEHGAPLPAGMGREEQVTMNGGGCNPDCIDTQFSIHVAADAVDGVSTSPVQRFSDGSTVFNSVSTLYRDKFGITVVTDTRLAEVP